MKGYAKLASLMGAHPETASFRRFGSLSAENLLYLQAELTRLEYELREITKENDMSSDERRSVYSEHWYSLMQAENTPNGDGRQWQLILKTRSVLKEYNEALIQQSIITKLPSTNPKDREFLVEWMQRPTMGRVYLLGKDNDSWKEENAPDLVSIKSRDDEVLFSSWTTSYFIHWFHRLMGKHFVKPKDAEYASNTVYYSDTAMSHIVHILMIVLASLLPVASIAVLNAVPSNARRIGILGGFTAIFSLCLGLLTSSRMVDIFAATAAFAAVQVVFIGTQSKCGCQG